MDNKYSYLDEHDDYFDSQSDSNIRRGAKLAGIQRNEKYHESHSESMIERSKSKWKENQAQSQVKRGLTHRGEKNGKFKGTTIATNIETGVVKRFDGCRAYEAEGFKRNSVTEAIKRNRPYKGYIWAREERRNGHDLDK